MPTYEALLPAHVDSTMISTFRSCPQKFFNEFCLGLRSETSIDLHAGAVFSATLERFYREVYKNGCDIPTALGRAYQTFVHDWAGFVLINPKHPKTEANMWAAVESYVGTYPPKTDPCQPYTANAESFEFSFAIPLDFPGFPMHPISGDPFLYVGRFDQLGMWNGRPVVRDEKTAQRLETNWSEKWDLRSQFLGYCWALQHNGIKCNTAIVRGVIITTKEVRQVEAIKVYPQFLIDRWFEVLKRDTTRLAKMWNFYQNMVDTGMDFPNSAFDFNLADSCTAYSGCPYVSLCSSPKPELWYSNFSVKRWNPLDRNPIDPTPSSLPPASPVLPGNPEAPSSASAPTYSGS